MVNDKLNMNEKKILDNRQKKINSQKEGTHIEYSTHNTNTITIVIILFVLALAGLIFMRFLEGLFMNSNNKSMIRMFAIAIILNVMILVFIIISFKRIHFAKGPTGPKGNRGNKGISGENALLNSCAVGDSILLSGQKKHNIRKKEAAYSRYPAIVDEP
jgi:Na+/proline symporter